MTKSRWAAPLVTALSLPLCAIAQESAIAPQPLSIEGATTHVYKSIGGVDLRLHVFRPPDLSTTMRRPAIVFFFGGGWASGSVEQFVPQARHLAQRGMVAVVADYRVSSRHQTTPFAAMADAKSAVRWLRAHAGELGVDPNRVVAGGGSSGGHLALSSAILEGFDEPEEDRRTSSKPNVLVLFNPVVDTSRSQRMGARALEGSPYHNVSRDLPPTVIFHGRADTTVPYAHVERYCAKAQELGNRCELFGYEGAEHGFFSPRVEEGRWYRETLVEADRFLTTLGYLPAPAPIKIP